MSNRVQIETTISGIHVPAYAMRKPGECNTQAVARSIGRANRWQIIEGERFNWDDAAKIHFDLFRINRCDRWVPLGTISFANDEEDDE